MSSTFETFTGTISDLLTLRKGILGIRAAYDGNDYDLKGATTAETRWKWEYDKDLDESKIGIT